MLNLLGDGLHGLLLVVLQLYTAPLLSGWLLDLQLDAPSLLLHAAL